MELILIIIAMMLGGIIVVLRKGLSEIVKGLEAIYEELNQK